MNYEKENIPEVCLKSVQPYLDDPEFDPEVIRKQSNAAAGLCAWIINTIKYYEVYCEVRTVPKSVQRRQQTLCPARQIIIASSLIHRTLLRPITLSSD